VNTPKTDVKFNALTKTMRDARATTKALRVVLFQRGGETCGDSANTVAVSGKAFCVITAEREGPCCFFCRARGREARRNRAVAAAFDREAATRCALAFRVMMLTTPPIASEP